MGLLKAWKEIKAVAASGMDPAPPAAARPRPGQRPHDSMLAGFAGVMAQMMGPLLAIYGPERGKPLPGTERQALSAAAGGLDAGAAALRARDAAFDAALLTAFAGEVFAAVSAAWGANDASGIRSVLADAAWDPIAAALGSGMGNSLRMIFAAQRAQPVLVGLDAGESYDSALFDVTVHLDLPGQELPPDVGTWAEQWLFQRSLQPGGDPMAFAETCPSCGAPAAVNTSGRCTHCRSPLPVLTAGWLLTFVRSHNPMVEKYYPQMMEEFRSDPSRLAQMPDTIARLLPPEVIIGADPARAARLGIEPPDAAAI